MKTSNKILLGIFLIGFSCLAAAQIALHIKYVNDEFITNEAFEAIYYNQYAPQHIKYVQVQGIAVCRIQQGPALKLLMEKNSPGYIHHEVNGDTLLITSYNTPDQHDNFRTNKQTQDIRLYLPAGTNIEALNTNLDIKGSLDSNTTVLYNIKLNNSCLYSRMNTYRDSINRYFDTINVVAHNNSAVFFYERDHLKTLNLQLDSSSIQDRYSTIQQLNLIADKRSTIVLSGGNIKNINSAVIK